MLRTLFVLLVPVIVSAGTATSFELLEVYPKKQSFPSAPLVEARDGRIYTVFREPNGPGGVARLARSGDLKVLRRFEETVGTDPSAVVGGEDGAVYGTCTAGGEYGTGTFWRFDGLTGTFARLQDFLLEGGEPVLQCLGPNSRLYGTYADGLFQATKRGEISTLVDFPQPGSEGAAEIAKPKCLIFGSDGALYGTSQDGGAIDSNFPNGYGALFKADGTGTFNQVAVFNATTGPAPAAIVEVPGLTGSPFFGITIQFDEVGDPLQAQLLKIDRGGAVTVLHGFGAGTGRIGPVPEILLGTDNLLYGFVPGTSDRIFRIDPMSGEATAVHTFSGVINGQNANLLLDRKGVLYGAATIGGITGAHAFRLKGLDLPVGNLPPSARDDLRVMPSEVDKTITLKPLKNDFDLDAAPEDILVIDDGADADEGDVLVSADGRTIAYTTVANVTRDVVRYTVIDADGATASAEILLSTTSASVTYAGLLKFRGTNNAYLNVLVTPSGVLTGNLRVAGRRFILKGALDEDDAYTFSTYAEFPRFEESEEEEGEEPTEGPAWTVDAGALVLTITQGENVLECNLEFDGEDVGLEDDESVPAATVPADGPGRYTLTLPPFDPNASAAQPAVPPTIESTSEVRRRPLSLGGDGWAIMAMDKFGAVSLLGRLADGRKFSFAGPCAGENSLPFYTFTNSTTRTLPGATLPLPRGVLAGLIKFGEDDSTEEGEGEESEGSAFTGTLTWKRTGLIQDNYQRFGFAVTQGVLGYEYKADPLAEAPLTFRKANRKFLVKGEFGATTTLDDTHADGFAEADGFILPEFGSRLGVDVRTGLVTGSFRHPVTRQRYFTSGVILQSLNQASGSYETPVASGRFTIKQK